jgi:hypothetical protein
MCKSRLLRFLLCGLTLAAAARAQSFNDVTSPYRDSANLMLRRAITIGCSLYPPLYCPADTLTRGQAAVFVIRAIFNSLSGNGEKFTYSPTPYFTDVPVSHPYFAYVQKMKELGITTGCTSYTYCPDDPVTNGQMAVFTVRG